MNNLKITKNEMQYPIRFNWLVEDESGRYVAAFMSYDDAVKFVESI